MCGSASRVALHWMVLGRRHDPYCPAPSFAPSLPQVSARLLAFLTCAFLLFPRCTIYPVHRIQLLRRDTYGMLRRLRYPTGYYSNRR